MIVKIKPRYRINTDKKHYYRKNEKEDEILMGAVKDAYMDMQEETEYLDEEYWDVYDSYMNYRVVGVPVETIKDVASYLSRHRWDYIMWLDIMLGQDGDWNDYYDDESCKRDYLRYVINTQNDNPNVNRVFVAIANYIKENWLDILFPDSK